MDYTLGCFWAVCLLPNGESFAPCLFIIVQDGKPFFKVMSLYPQGELISIWFLCFHFTHKRGNFIFVCKEPVHFQMTFGASEIVISIIPKTKRQ